MASRGVEDSSFQCFIDSSSSLLPCKTSRPQCPFERSKAACFRAKIQLFGDFLDLSAFDERLQYIAEVCIFHRYLLHLFIYSFASGSCKILHVDLVHLSHSHA